MPAPPFLSRRAWITGGGAGIGRALALRLSAQGWTVAVSARSADKLADVAAAATAGAVCPYVLDVTDAAATAAVIARIEDDLGPLDLAVLNAGTHLPMGAADYSVSTARALMEVNYMGVVHGLAALLPRFIARGRGQVAVVSSVAGWRGLPSAAAYGPTKAALINLCESLRPECRRAGVDLRLVCPGFVATPLTARNDFPMPDIITAEQAADEILRGLAGSRFEIAFPWRFACLLRLARRLPYRLYFALTERMLPR